MPQKKTKLSASPSLARTTQRSAPRYEKKQLTFPDHLLGIRELTPQQIHQLIDRASHIADEIQAGRPCKPALSGRTLINLFYEDSTRTRTSFELAGKNLGATVINISLANSSIKKGETLLDTAATLNAMRPDILVMRHQRAGAAHLLAPKMNCSLVNAGDGAHEHPTQALLDALTIKRHKGKFEGLRIALCGDILHSRVARSNILLLNALGANLRVIAPGPLLPKAVDQMGVEMFSSMREGLRDVDIIMMLRLQTERMSGSFVPSRREYFRFFGLDREKLSLARDDALVLHPGPINRGLEIDPEIADGPQSLIREQVEMGIAIRMAVLAALSLRGTAS